MPTYRCIYDPYWKKPQIWHIQTEQPLTVYDLIKDAKFMFFVISEHVLFFNEGNWTKYTSNMFTPENRTLLEKLFNHLLKKAEDELDLSELSHVDLKHVPEELSLALFYENASGFYIYECDEEEPIEGKEWRENQNRWGENLAETFYDIMNDHFLVHHFDEKEDKFQENAKMLMKDILRYISILDVISQIVPQNSMKLAKELMENE